MANISAIKLPNGTTYTLKDNGALQLTGGQVTGSVTFGDSVSIDEATLGDLVVNGSASFTNNIQANTINGVAVGNSPKFTDTVTTVTTTGSGNAITAISATNGAITATKGTTFLTSHQDISGKADKATTLSGYGITDAKIASGVITLGSNTITPLTSSSTLSASKLSGAIPSAVTATTQASTDNSTKIATTAYVTTAIANLPEPMVFKGSVGTGGTVTSLPTAAASNEGHTYKVITALSSPAAKVGDTVISNGSSWVVIPSGDEPSGTVTSVGVSNATNGGLTISGSPITSSGTITIGHSNVLTSAQTTQAVYPIKIDKNGHISAYGNAITIPSDIVSGSGSTDYLARWSNTNTLSTTSIFISTSYNSSSDSYGTIKLYVGSTGQLDWKGQLVFYSGDSSKTITITPPSLTSSRTITLPDKTGTIALTSDIPTVSYPVTSVNNKTGAVSLTASDVGALASSTTYVSTITTTAGTHSAISSKSGAVSFNVPTKTSHLTNDSGFVTTDTNTTYALSGALSSHKFTSTLTAGGSGSGTSTSDFTLAAGTGITITDDTSNRKMTIGCSITNTDTKVSTAVVTSGTTYYPVLGSDTTSAESKFYDKTGISYLGTSGSSTNGIATLTLGNNISGGSGKYGKLTIYSAGQYSATLKTGSTFLTDRTFNLPDKSGTIALTGDLNNYILNPSNAEYANDNWVLSYGNGWVPTSAFQIMVTPNFDAQSNLPDGTYSCLTSTELIQNAYNDGCTLELRIDLPVSSSSDELVTNVLTDYYYRMIQYPDESDYYGVIEFTGIIGKIGANQQRIICRIYIDENEGVHTNGEVTVIVSTLTTIGDYGITDAKISNGTITLGSNTITPLTGSSTLFYYDTFTASNYDFTANQYRSLTKTITARTGYSRIIISVRCTSHSGLQVFNWSLSENTITYEVINRTSSSISGANFVMNVLYIKSSLIGS